MSENHIISTDPNVLLGTKEPLVISPEEAKRRIGGGVRDGGKSGGHSISRAEARSIAVQIGQEVYDQLRAEHALAMGQLSDDLKNHFTEIRRVTATNILDIQRRSFSYRIRRDFDVDLQRMAAKLAELWGRIHLDFAVDVESIVAWLELHGLRKAPAEAPEAERGGMYKNYIKVDPSVPPDELHVRDAQGNTTKIVNLRNATDEEVEPENVGAPTELPDDPEVARAFTLSSQE